jgi:hypothetical protein
MRVALGWLYGGFRVALGCLSPGYQQALRWLRVALGGFLHSTFFILHSPLPSFRTSSSKISYLVRVIPSRS